MPELIPADLKQCQVNKYNPFVMGGKVHARCENTPVWLICETVPAEDGLMGEQTVCQACRDEWEAKTGIPGVDPTWKWKPIKEGKFDEND